MRWQFAAIVDNERPEEWIWVWRQLTDDGLVVRQSAEFDSLEEALDDARREGCPDELPPDLLNGGAMPLPRRRHRRS